MELASIIVIALLVIILAAIGACYALLKQQIQSIPDEMSALANEHHKDLSQDIERAIDDIKNHFEIHIHNINRDLVSIQEATESISEDFSKLRSLQEFSVSELTSGNTRIQDTLSDGLRKQQHQIQELSSQSLKAVEHTSEQNRKNIQKDLAQQSEGLIKLADSSQRMLSTIIGHFNLLNKDTSMLKKATAMLVTHQKSITSETHASRQSLDALQETVQALPDTLNASSQQDELILRVDNIRRQQETGLITMSSRLDQQLQTLAQQQGDASPVSREDLTSQKIAIDDVREQIIHVSGELNSLAEAFLDALSTQGQQLTSSIDQNQTTLYTELDSVRQEQIRLNDLSTDLQRLVKLLRLRNQQVLSFDQHQDQLTIETPNGQQHFRHCVLERSDDSATGETTRYFYNADHKTHTETTSQDGILKYRMLFDENESLTKGLEFDDEGKEIYRYQFNPQGEIVGKVRVNYDASGMPTGETTELMQPL